VVIERKAFRRGISIYVKPKQPIRVVTSVSMPIEKIDEFLAAKEKWLEKHLQKFAEHQEKFPEKKLLQSETFPFLGKNLRLKFEKTGLKSPFFTRTDEHLNLHLPESMWEDLQDEDLEQFWPGLQNFYKREAETLISERIRVWSEQMDLRPNAVRFRNQKSRWGSCSSRGNININWRLIGAPLEVIDYILVHELSHLQHMDHSKDFWRLVAKHQPQYLESEKWLDENHAALDFLLRKEN
jgi:predicted metal-dependent hydrolase